MTTKVIVRHGGAGGPEPVRQLKVKQSGAGGPETVTLSDGEQAEVEVHGSSKVTVEEA